jgi:hypothetical protein
VVRVRSLLLVSVVCLAAGVAILFTYCNGTTSLAAGYPFSGTSLHLDVTTTGIPAVIGVPLTLIGSFLLIIAWILALFTRPKRIEADDTDEAPRSRRSGPFKQ